VKHGLRLTTITRLFAIITTLSLREQRCLGIFRSEEIRDSGSDSKYLSRLVLRNLVLCVLAAVLALAVGASGLGYVDLLRVEVLALV
jgi:hypothetical protein